jgi:hypothetical protein
VSEPLCTETGIHLSTTGVRNPVKSHRMTRDVPFDVFLHERPTCFDRVEIGGIGREKYEPHPMRSENRWSFWVAVRLGIIENDHVAGLPFRDETVRAPVSEIRSLHCSFLGSQCPPNNLFADPPGVAWNSHGTSIQGRIVDESIGPFREGP